MPKLIIIGKSGVEYEAQCWVCSSRDAWDEEESQGVYDGDNVSPRTARCRECGNVMTRLPVEAPALDETG